MFVEERTWSHDPTGNISERTRQSAAEIFAYDALDRLIGQQIDTAGKSWQYDYGPNHNRQRRTDGDLLLNEVYQYQPESN